MLAVAALLAAAAPSALALQCWQCASVDGKSCPEDATMVESNDHDACITWRLGNGTVLLQNVVAFQNECTAAKIDFWARFIDLYYKSRGGEVRCCDADGCNTGAVTDDYHTASSVAMAGTGNNGNGRPTASIGATGATGGGGGLPGAPLIFGAMSNGGGGGLSAQPKSNQALTQQQQLAALLAGSPGATANLASLMAAGSGSQGGQAFPGAPSLAHLGGSPALTQQLLVSRQQQQQQQLNALQSPFLGQSAAGAVGGFAGGLGSLGALASLGGAAGLIGSGLSGSSGMFGSNGNCQRYFPKRGDGEWLPTTLMPLSYDRASETKVGVFYMRFTAENRNNDHIIVRLVGNDKSNHTMYSIKLYRVGSVSLYVSYLDRRSGSNGESQPVEVRQITEQNVVNLTDTSSYRGFWFTVRGEEIAMGVIGDRLIDPIMIWNDTDRDGPRDVAYFALTTDQSQASFGVNCDVPHLHFDDTCVSDEDCLDYPNTVCSSKPVNKGLDPGTRRTPFEEWEDRDTLLKSCFCKEGHIRIPGSKGCYDPIRHVVTLRDACFANYHCEHLPNTRCASDRNVPKFNNSCQCVPGNKAFEPDPRTGLVEGCAPLTDADRASVLGCADKIELFDEVKEEEWVPKETFTLQTDSTRNVQYAVVYVKMASAGATDDEAFIRLLDNRKSNRKMLTIKFSKRSGRISICESSRSRGFFFNSARDHEKSSIDDLDIMTRMQLDYVGFWLQYEYEENVGGTLSLGLNGSPFSSDYALIKWTDTNQDAIEELKYIGFTASARTHVMFGFNCVLVDTPIAKAGTSGANIPAANAAGLGGLSSFAGLGGANGLAAGGLSSLAAMQQLAALQQQQQQQLLQVMQQQSLGSNPAALAGLLTPQAAAGRSGGAGPTLTHPSIPAAAVEPEDPTVIIEPVHRNQYLTKLKRLLPDIFDEEDYHEDSNDSRGAARLN